MLIGTSHFVSFDTAVRHYTAYQYPNTREAVSEKIASGEISIGRPAAKPGERVVIVDTGTRYAILK